LRGWGGRFAQEKGNTDFYISSGNYESDIRPRSPQDQIRGNLKAALENQREAADLLNKIAEGKLFQKVFVLGDKDHLGHSINALIQSMKEWVRAALSLSKEIPIPHEFIRSEDDELRRALVEVGRKIESQRKKAPGLKTPPNNGNARISRHDFLNPAKTLKNLTDLWLECKDLPFLLGRSLRLLCEQTQSPLGEILFLEEKRLVSKALYLFHSQRPSEKSLGIQTPWVQRLFQSDSPFLVLKDSRDFPWNSHPLTFYPREVFFSRLGSEKDLLGIIRIAAFSPMPRFQKEFLKKGCRFLSSQTCRLVSEPIFF